MLPCTDAVVRVTHTICITGKALLRTMRPIKRSEFKVGSDLITQYEYEYGVGASHCIAIGVSLFRLGHLSYSI